MTLRDNPLKRSKWEPLLVAVRSAARVKVLNGFHLLFLTWVLYLDGSPSLRQMGNPWTASSIVNQRCHWGVVTSRQRVRRGPLTHLRLSRLHSMCVTVLET